MILPHLFRLRYVLFVLLLFSFAYPEIQTPGVLGNSLASQPDSTQKMTQHYPFTHLPQVLIHF